jgi:hypothetical protein
MTQYLLNFHPFCGVEDDDPFEQVCEGGREIFEEVGGFAGRGGFYLFYH